MLQRVFSEDATYRRMKPENTIKRFCEKYDKLEWKEVFDWMLEDGTEHFSDTMMADGSKNQDWCYSLWLEVEGDYTYIALIERA